MRRRAHRVDVPKGATSAIDSKVEVVACVGVVGVCIYLLREWMVRKPRNSEAGVTLAQPCLGLRSDLICTCTCDFDRLHEIQCQRLGDM